MQRQKQKKGRTPKPKAKPRRRPQITKREKSSTKLTVNFTKIIFKSCKIIFSYTNWNFVWNCFSLDETAKDPEKEYEVERIIDVHFKKNKTRDFLIRWKGFSARDDTWEPEENLNCQELIAKFMEKVEKARNAAPKELRANRKHTEHYVTHTHGKRHSRRHTDKQR